MTTTITVRGLNPEDTSWLQQEARNRGVSMAALVRQFIHESRERSEHHGTPAEVFRRHFGPEHGGGVAASPSLRLPTSGVRR